MTLLWQNNTKSDEYQTLYCTECGRMLKFRTKKEKNGNLIIVCDGCGHQHCRVVINGAVTGDRWDSRYGSVDRCFGVEANS